MSADPLPSPSFEGDWRNQAACREADPRLFDYDPETDAKSSVEAATRVCAHCRVRGVCLSYALCQPAEDDSVGIYGGLTPAERAERRAQQLEERSAPGWRSRRVATGPAFARVSFDLATGVGLGRAAEALGVTNRTLQRSWKRHGLGPRRLGPLACDPEFAVSSFELAGEFGTIRAAKHLGVSAGVLYRAWDRQALGRPPKPQGWTKQFMADRELVDQAFGLAREQSILAAASAFQVNTPTLRRAFAHHGLGHPHAGLEQSELKRRWSTQAQDEPDHHHRQQRRLHRARLAAERRAP